MARKIKNVRMYSWDPNSKVAVELEEKEHWHTGSGNRAFEVYLDGVHIGQIESGEGQKSRPESRKPSRTSASF